jgi:anthranilate phosphoribosyltransferase
MIKEAIVKAAKGIDLSVSEAEGAFTEILDQAATSAQIAALLTALAVKGENEDEIYAAAKVVRAHAQKIKVRNNFLGIDDPDEAVFDSCGTGGSNTQKFNVSTAVAFVVAASGVKTAKHGNRAMSSRCGSADCFEALSIAAEVEPAVAEAAIKDIGIGFLFAPLYHPALKSVAQIRREIGIRTIFNILGPLTNPAGTTAQLLGVCEERFILPVARALKALGVKRALVFSSKDLKDEISLSSRTRGIFVNGAKLTKMNFSASAFGLKKVLPAAIKVKSAKESAVMVRAVLSGKDIPARRIVLANAAAAFFVLGKALDIKAGVKLAAQLIDGKKALKKLEELKDFLKSKGYAPDIVADC